MWNGHISLHINNQQLELKSRGSLIGRWMTVAWWHSTLWWWFTVYSCFHLLTMWLHLETSSKREAGRCSCVGVHLQDTFHLGNSVKKTLWKMDFPGVIIMYSTSIEDSELHGKCNQENSFPDSPWVSVFSFLHFLFLPLVSVQVWWVTRTTHTVSLRTSKAAVLEEFHSRRDKLVLRLESTTSTARQTPQIAVLQNDSI